ncbi:MAG: insulinase family protein [Chloroflexi bacterium]|nr:MAG: insulinase family protein [Chloroflexota bacterium]
MYQKTTLPNGLRVLSVPMPHLRSVSIGFFIAVGSRYESAAIGGASHFIEHMLFKGTEQRPSAQQIAAAIEGIGGAFNASTGHELTVYWAKTATPHFPIAFDVLTDMLRRAKFDHAEIEKERTVIIEEIKSTADNPDDLAHQLSDELMWPAHPLGRDIAGTKESVAALRREQLLDYLSLHWRHRHRRGRPDRAAPTRGAGGAHAGRLALGCSGRRL